MMRRPALLCGWPLRLLSLAHSLLLCVARAVSIAHKLRINFALIHKEFHDQHLLDELDRDQIEPYVTRSFAVNAFNLEGFGSAPEELHKMAFQEAIVVLVVICCAPLTPSMTPSDAGRTILRKMTSMTMTITA